MTDIKIPDDIERWEKKGLKEDIDTDAEHVHEIFVWKNFAVEHESWGERDRGHWNPYVIMNGHPLKLDQGGFDSFDTAIGHLKGLMKDKKLTLCDEIDCDDDEGEDIDCPKHPCGDMVKAKVDMRTRFAMMNADDDSWKQAYKAEIDGLRKAGDYFQKLKEEDAQRREREDPRLKGLTDKVQNDQEMPKIAPGDMSYQTVGSDGIPSSHIHNVANTGSNNFGGAVDQDINGATLNQGLAPGANPYGRDVAGGKVKPAPALGGRTQDLGKLLDRVDVNPGTLARQEGLPQYTTYAGLKPIITRPAEGFMAGKRGFASNALRMMDDYNNLVRGVPNGNTLFQHDGPATMADLLGLSPAQLRSLVINMYRERGLDGQLVAPTQLKNIPILGGIQYANPNITSRTSRLLNDKGWLDPELFSMAATELDDLVDEGESYTRNSNGLFPYKWGGVSAIHSAQDINGEEDAKWWIRGKERLPSTDLVLDALSEANKRIMDTPVKDTDVADYIASRFGPGADPAQAIAPEVMKNILSPYLNNEDGSAKIDNAGNPITQEGALNMWGADQVRNRQLDDYINTLEPLVMHWMDNMPMNQMDMLMDKTPYLRRNMAQTDDERRKWYNDLFNSGAVRNRLYDGDPIQEWKKYISTRGNGSSGPTNAQENDQHERESGIRSKPISTGAKTASPKTDKKTKGGMDAGTKTTDETAASMKDLVSKTGVGSIKTEMNDSKDTGAQDDFGIEADAKMKEKKAKADAEDKARKDAEDKADKERKEREKGEDVKKAIMDRFAFFSPGFTIAKADEPDVMAGVPDNGKEDTRPRIAAYRTVTMGEGKDSVFNAVVDAETGKIAFTMDDKN